MEARNARFILENCRITRVKELEKVCFLTVSCQDGKYPNYYDLALFVPPQTSLTVGAVVTIKGDVSKRKPKDGGKEWTLQLVAKDIQPGDASKAPQDKRSAHQGAGTGDDSVPW